jgi:hypothetical protein
MRMLVIDEAAKAEIARVVAYAWANVVTRRKLLAAMEGMEPPVGDEAGYVCLLCDGYRVVFSIENQPAGICRHLSVSIPGTGGAWPSQDAVVVISAEFGFGKGTMYPVWTEEEVRAVNMVEVIGKEG